MHYFEHPKFYFWQPLTSIFVHYDVMHLGFNMLMLTYVGALAEAALGPRGTVILYLIGAYCAALVQFLPDPGGVTPMVGASGAISALVGAAAIFYGQSRARAIGPIPARIVHVIWLAVAWTAVNWGMAVAFSTADMGLAWLAHVGGFLAGALLAHPLLRWRFGKAQPPTA